jgi:hypothetical protein
MTELKHRVIIDVYPTEDGEDVFFVGKESLSQDEQGLVPCPLLGGSGFFTHEDALNQWLEENAHRLEITADYRL